MKKILLTLMLFIIFTTNVNASCRGCCSYHGGVSNRCKEDMLICNDGTVSPSCKCYSCSTIESLYDENGNLLNERNIYDEEKSQDNSNYYWLGGGALLAGYYYLKKEKSNNKNKS